MELFLTGVDIDRIGKLVKNYVCFKMQEFFGGNMSYIEGCSVHVGFMTNKDAGGISDGQRDHFLFAGNGGKIQTLEELEQSEGEAADLIAFQSAMVEQLGAFMDDKEPGHFTTGFRHYHGSGQSRMFLSRDDMLSDHYIVWCIYTAGSKGGHPVSELMRKVLLSFLEQCFKDSQQLLCLTQEDSSGQRLLDLVRNAQIDLVATYVNAVVETYQTDCEIFNKISVDPQEKRECKGRLLFVDSIDQYRKRHSDAALIFEMGEQNPQKRKLSNIQGTRKLLEACEENYLLVDRNGNDLVGISNQVDDECGFISVQFHGTANWELKVHGNTVLVYDRCSYFAGHILDITSGSDMNQYKHICGFETIMNAAREARNGALVIIAADAAEEAKRLEKANRAIKVEPFRIDSEAGKKMIAGLMNVDGAVLVDFQGMCEGFSVILDGIAVVRGMEEKGSRYNSAMNYIGGKDKIAIVVSEDKSKGIVVKHGKDVELLETALDQH